MAAGFSDLGGQRDHLLQGRESREQSVDFRVGVIGVALHADDPSVIRDGREEHRLDVETLVKEVLASFQCVDLVANQNRKDWRRSAADDEIELRQPM